MISDKDVINMGKESSRVSGYLILFYMCLLLVGFVPANIISIFLVILMILMFQKKEFYYIYPAGIVYYSYLYVPFTGMSLYRLYSLMVLFKLIMSSKFFIRKKTQLIQAIILILYMLFAVTFVNVRTAFFGIVDIVVIYLLVANVMCQKEHDDFEKIMGAFAIACVCSVVTGQLRGNVMSLSYQINGKWRATNRFVGTFVDPNYCSFMYIFAIISLLVLKPFKNQFNKLLIVVLVIGIAMTISFSGFVGLTIVYVFYIGLIQKISFKHFIGICLVLLGIAGVYWYGTTNTDVPILGDIVYRVNSYILNYEGSSTGGLAVSRITIYKNILYKFNSQVWYKQLFGMNTDVPIITQSSILVAHNDYVDMMYNCGLFFTLIFYVIIIYRCLFACYLYIKTKDNRMAFIAISKFLWLYFAFTLTMLSERTFFLCLFV